MIRIIMEMIIIWYKPAGVYLHDCALSIVCAQNNAPVAEQKKIIPLHPKTKRLIESVFSKKKIYILTIKYNI